MIRSSAYPGYGNPRILDSGTGFIEGEIDFCACLCSMLEGVLGQGQLEVLQGSQVTTHARWRAALSWEREGPGFCALALTASSDMRHCNPLEVQNLQGI